MGLKISESSELLPDIWMRARKVDLEDPKKSIFSTFLTYFGSVPGIWLDPDLPGLPAQKWS